MANKKPTLSERMAAEFSKVAKPHVSVVDFIPQHKRHEPGFPANFHVMRVSEREPGQRDPQVVQMELENQETRTYDGYIVDLPSGQKAYWSKHTPKSAIDKGLLTDEKLNKWADQWMQPGGNRYAEYLYADRLWNVYGLWENYNLKPSVPGALPWSDHSHYFDWNKWKANYNRLKG